MERRLIRAYDHMTMPDRCVQKLERQLQCAEENRKAGYYTQIITPTPQKKYGTLRSVAAACLMLVLILGGSLILLQQLNPAAPAAVTPTEPEQTPWDHYAQVTDYSVEKVENTAKIIRSNILEKNWEALRNKVNFKVTIQGEEVTDFQTFVDWMEIYSLNPEWQARLEQEDCRAMFCNWQGISMADGLIWINEEFDGLMITAVNMEIQEEPEDGNLQKQVPDVFAEIISGDRIKMVGVVDKLTVEEYCADWQAGVKLDAFAVVDMDGDDICELVFSLTDEQGEAQGNLVLRQVGDAVSCCSFRAGELVDLKKDGSFLRRGRDYRLYFNDKTSWHTEEVRNRSEKPPAQWHTYPCQRPDLLLRSYEYVTGTGWNNFPSIPYSYFESVVQGRASNDLQVFQYWGIDYAVMEDDRIYIFDPDAPGTAVYGTLTEADGCQRFSELGFYMATEEKEYMAEVRNMLSKEPEYWVDAHLPALGSMGRQVFSPEELIGYLGFTLVPEEETLRDQEAIRTLVDNFLAACLSGDPKDMEPYLAENAQGTVGRFPKDGTLEVVNYGYLPDHAMGEWGRYAIYPTAQIPGEEGQLSLYLELVKQPDGWKVETYRVER